jgi:hypothetical protein
MGLTPSMAATQGELTGEPAGNTAPCPRPLRDPARPGGDF